MKRKAKLIGVVFFTALIAGVGYMLGVYNEQTGAKFNVILKAFVELFYLYDKLNIIKEKRYEESDFSTEEYVGMR